MLCLFVSRLLWWCVTLGNRKREAELEAKLKEDSTFGSVVRVMQGIRVTLLEMPGLDRVTKRVRESKLKQYSIIGIDDSGRFNVCLR